MNGAEVLDIARDAIWLTLQLSAPVLIVGLVVFLVAARSTRASRALLDVLMPEMPGCETHQIVQRLMLDCLPRTSNSPTWTRSLGGRRRAWRVESAMRTDCLVIFVIPSMRDAVFTVSP